MMLADANLLLYAYDSASAHHAAARAWLEASISAAEPFALSWQTITAFIRITTNPRAYRSPLSAAEADAIVSAWLDRPSVVVLAPGERHWEIFCRLLREGQAVGPLVMDAHLAALAIEHGAVLCTTDRDFSRFPGLRTSNPIAA